MPKKKQPAKAQQAVALAEYAAKALVAAEHLRIKTKAVKQFPLDQDERATVAHLPALPVNVKKKLAKKGSSLTVAEVASMVMAVGESFLDAEPKQQIVLLLVAKKLMDCLQENIVMPDLPAKGRKASATVTVYQFKITLLESHPPIWRRIQVKDCTLDKLHEHIQTAMGWTNSHLHHFQVNEQLYGDPRIDGRQLRGDGVQGLHNDENQRHSPEVRQALQLHLRIRFRRFLVSRGSFRGMPETRSRSPVPNLPRR